MSHWCRNLVHKVSFCRMLFVPSQSWSPEYILERSKITRNIFFLFNHFFPNCHWIKSSKFLKLICVLFYSERFRFWPNLSTILDFRLFIPIFVFFLVQGEVTFTSTRNFREKTFPGRKSIRNYVVIKKIEIYWPSNFLQ